jgi:hypothetical protein
MIGYDIGEAMAIERRGMLIDDALRSLLFVVLGAGLLYGALRVATKWRLAILGGLAILVVVDILPVNLRYMPHDKFVTPKENKIHPTEANKEIMKDKEPGYRVFNATVSTFNDATTSMFHRSVGGYHGAKMGRYQDVIDYYFEGDQNYMPILDMLNTKYFIVPKYITNADGEPELDPNGGIEVQENPYRLGAAWFVQDVKCVDDAKEALEALGRFEGRKWVITPGIIECGILEECVNAELGQNIATSGADKIILVGETLINAVKEGYQTANGDMKKLTVVKTLAQAQQLLGQEVQTGDCVLFLNDLPDVY